MAKHTEYRDILESMSMNDIPEDLIFNWDQMGFNLVPGALWTMDKKGKKHTEINGLQDKHQITGLFCLHS